ncbi:MAG: MFS transporter, partial [Bryobacteraceae bacterium]
GHLVKKTRWLMISLAFWATVINYLDRQSLSVAAPVLREQFHMSNEVYSRVVFAFLLAYTVANGISGPLIDRLGTKVGYALCIGWWSIASILHAFATGPITLGLARLLLGIGEAGNWPAAIKLVAEWFPEMERALACGIFNSGSSVGAIIAPPLVAWILLTWGWPAAFVTTGVTGLVWLCVWWPIYETPVSAVKEPETVKVPVAKLLRHKFVWSLMIAKIFFDSAWYFYIFWFPEYLKHARDFSMASIGKYGWIPFLVAGSGNLLGGWLSGYLIRRGYSVTIARKGTVTLFMMLMLSSIPAVLVTNVWVSIAFVSIAMVGYTGGNANLLAMPADIFPKHLVSSVWGLASMGSGFGGMVFTLITGWVVERYSYTPVFIGFGLIPLIAATILWTMCGPLRPSSLGMIEER